jgi:hypothetical protein
VITTAPASLEEAIRRAGEGRLIDSFTPPEQAIAHFLGILELVQQEGRARLGGHAPRIDEETLVHEFQRNPQRTRGFFQALGGGRTPEMLLMVWRIIQGMQVMEIVIDYRLRESFRARVVLVSPHGEEDAPYASTDIHDFTLLRHIGILEMGGAPVFDGFYALGIPAT